MKKLLSILLTASMIGAPVASNCFALKWNGTKIEMKDETGETTEKFNNIMLNMFTLNGTEDMEAERLAKLKEVHGIINKATDYKEANKVLKEFATIELNSNEELETFKAAYNLCYNYINTPVKPARPAPKPAAKKKINKIESRQDKKEESIAPSTPITPVANETKKEEIKEIPQNAVTSKVEKEIMKESQTAEATKEAKKLDKVVGDNQDKVEIKVDEKETKNKGSLMFKVIVAGTVIAVISYAGLIAYDMYANGTSFKDANLNLWNLVSGYASQGYNYIKDATSNLFSYVKGWFAKDTATFAAPTAEDVAKCPAPTAEDLTECPESQAKSSVFGKVLGTAGAILGSKIAKTAIFAVAGVGSVVVLATSFLL